MNMGNLEKAVLERLAQAADWFFGHLTISEGRAERDIELALQVIAESAAEDGLTGEGLIDARELFFDDLHAFCDDPAALQDAVSIDISRIRSAIAREALPCQECANPQFGAVSVVLVWRPLNFVRCAAHGALARTWHGRQLYGMTVGAGRISMT
ncbi:hypothetical protein KDW20_19290 [Burkholderia cenocepacia]|uniref:hypothetical protein n=1 Tax=Burkholderia cenocepacia TaxID=95486 RepID=UPI001B9FE4D7|nr:hypothetical protein [Burkholderia cenocepacia]MBR8377922.1 hypothetical protein [Burkholderia cenocepacia]